MKDNKILVLPLILLSIDQISKITAVKYLTEEKRVFGEFITLQLHRNPGAAFSILTEHTPLLSIIAITAIVIILLQLKNIKNNPEKRAQKTPLLVLLSGILGNLADRIFREPSPFNGSVIDFINVKNFAVFNFSDTLIFISLCLLLIRMSSGSKQIKR
ncbi:MAG: signal peptidase II [Candidatus Paceibacterota bacterium]